MRHSMIPPTRNGRTQAVPQRWTTLTALVLLLVVLASLQLAPSVSTQGRDSGIFAYTGRVIRDGGRPYVDAWDNKLPGVYFIDALAFAVFGTNRWALWLVENLALFATVLVMCWLLRQRYGQGRLVWIGAVILVLLARHPVLINDTNYTEPFALLPQVIVLAAGYQMLRDPHPRWAFVIGFASGIALLFKQTTIGVALMLFPALLLSRHPIVHDKRRIRWVATIVGGGLAALLPVLIYLVAYGILDDAFDASFVMARSFHVWVGEESVWVGRTLVSTFVASEFPLVYGPLLPFIGIGIYLAWKQSRPRPHATPTDQLHSTLAVWVVLMFFTDLTLANITNRGYGHYYVPLLPSVTLLMVMTIKLMDEWREHPRTEKLIKRARLYLVVILIGIPMTASIVRFWQADWNVTGPERRNPLAEYVIEHTLLDDSVLVWGAATTINFQSGRKSPTRFHYGYPLIVPDYTTEEMIEELILDLRTNMPVMIVDTTLRDGYRIPPLDPAHRAQWYAEGGRRDTENLDPIYRFVDHNCRVEAEINEATYYRCFYDDPDPIIFKRHYAGFAAP